MPASVSAAARGRADRGSLARACDTVTASEPGNRREHPIAARAPGAACARWLPSGAVYALLVVLCLLAAYWAMFSQFAPYDDEGFFDYSLKLFVGGHTLYNSVFSEYGPFYYELFGGLFALIGHGVNTDAGRLIQLVVWVAASLGLGLVAHRLTGSTGDRRRGARHLVHPDDVRSRTSRCTPRRSSARC